MEKQVSFLSFFLAAAGSLIGIIGIILGVFGEFFVFTLGMSNFTRIRVAVSLIGIALPLLISGLSIIFESKIKWIRYIVFSGCILSGIGVILFIYYYPADWYYPQVGTIYAVYAAGIIIEISSLFSILVLEKIRELTEIRREIKEKREEEVLDDRLIELDIDGILKNSRYKWSGVGSTAELSKLVVEPSSVVVRGAVKDIVRKMDEIDKDVGRLRAQSNVERKKDVDIDKTIITILNKNRQKKKGLFHR